MAIELIMVRYCWAFAYYSEADPYVNKIREKVSTTFKSNSATTEDHEFENLIDCPFLTNFLGNSSEKH